MKPLCAFSLARSSFSLFSCLWQRNASFELTPEVVHEPVTSPTKQSDYHKQNPHARGKASGGQMAHPSARFQGVAATAGEMPSGPEETRLSTKVRAPPGGLSSFVFG